MLSAKDITAITSIRQFEEAALEVFAFQAVKCAPYREYIDLLGINYKDVTSYEKIPHLPIGIFKSHKVYCGEEEPEKIFTSSTTGGDTPSKHHMASLKDYETIFSAAFTKFYGSPADWSFYCLLPGYLEREGSSLVYMADRLIRAGGGRGGFFLRNHHELLEKMASDPRKKILLGVSYALLDLAEKDTPRLTDTIVMETGGMKGKRREMPKEELHAVLKEAFGVDHIHSEYGMAELTSQAYSYGEGIFRSPDWMRVWVRDPNDPFREAEYGIGGINITDLGNLSSCAFIQTEDMGRCFEDGSFAITGRLANTPTRGCNLLVE